MRITLRSKGWLFTDMTWMRFRAFRKFHCQETSLCSPHFRRLTDEMSRMPVSCRLLECFLLFCWLWRGLSYGRAGVRRPRCTTSIVRGKKKGQDSESPQESAAIEKMFGGWYESTLERLKRVEPLKKVSLPADYVEAEGTVGKEQIVRYSCTAFHGTQQIDYFRAVSFHGLNFHVLNMLVIPNLKTADQPLLGIDIVTLPGGTLANIDFQPLQHETAYLKQPIFTDHTAKLKKWQMLLPSGGDLPQDALKYFSPLCLWSRFPPARRDACLFLVGQALSEYSDIYCEELRTNSASVLSPAASPLLTKDSLHAHDSRLRSQKGLQDYLKYRIENDPAKHMLAAAFGRSWTETVLRDILFPSFS